MNTETDKMNRKIKGCVEMRKTELEGRHRCFHFVLGLDSYFKLVRVHIQPRYNEDLQFNQGKNGFNLRTDLTDNRCTTNRDVWAFKSVELQRSIENSVGTSCL